MAEGIVIVALFHHVLFALLADGGDAHGGNSARVEVEDSADFFAAEEVGGDDVGGYADEAGGEALGEDAAERLHVDQRGDEGFRCLHSKCHDQCGSGGNGERANDGFFVEAFGADADGGPEDH